MTGQGAVLMAIVAAPLLAAVFAVTAGRRNSLTRTVNLVGACAAGISLLLSVVVTVIVFQPGTDAMSADLWPGSGVPALSLMGDRITAVLLLLVCSVSTIVQLFAGRYLTGDSRASWFTASTALLTAASAGLMSAGTLITFAICWSVAGLAMWLLLGTNRSLPDARDGQTKTARAFLVGDGALWLAVILVSVSVGTVQLNELNLGLLAEHPVTLTAAGILAVVAALSRSAQLPLPGWLPATLAAPTPVSALLHAGVVNAGGVLLIRLAPLVRPSDVAIALAVVAATATIGYAGVLMLVKPDIKGSLTRSTMAQMGFMILTGALGLYAATLFHLVAHGLYKASLFLSSGAETAHVQRGRAAPPAPKRSRGWLAGTLVLALAAPTLTLLAAEYLLANNTHTASALALLLFALASSATLLYSWLRRAPGIASAASFTVLICVAVFAYAAVVLGFTNVLDTALPPFAAITAAPWILVAIALILTGLSVFIRAGGSSRFGGLRHAVYAYALAASHVTPAHVHSSTRKTTAGATR
ncbi:sodium:proton antiporter [Nakamurella antarctica]|uniref:Sodium:proton antiporter n=1 Tax=Nakamurella antarctica TaxID=1902245 RepID=A0A3G8ZM32_9ACTN|nr:proton-conducting transporter membrane subunit [Nakamurella antarctica]AZI58290.1 sodium:proton antiporter [Nakamurella antarctica]